MLDEENTLLDNHFQSFSSECQLDLLYGLIALHIVLELELVFSWTQYVIEVPKTYSHSCFSLSSAKVAKMQQ